MKIVYQVTVTDEDVRQNVMDVIDEMEGEIEFHNDDEKSNFITDCTENICDKYESEYWNHELSYMDYEEEVLDLAREYGIRKD